MRRFLFLPLLALCAPACRSEMQEAAQADDSAFTEEDARCFAVTPAHGESATEARAHCLTEQASRLIDAQIARGEDPRDAMLAAFKGKLRVPAETGCFTEDVGAGPLGLVETDI